MTKFDPFYKLAERFNPDGLQFDKVCLPDNYPLDTLINGNISECIAYLRLLIGTGGMNGVNAVHDVLINIKEHCPNQYTYIKNKVFGY